MAQEDDDPPSAKALDWESIFKLAEDPDLDEIVLSPLESAIQSLNTGKEVKKLAAIRNFPQLITDHGEECIDKMLPAIQKCLKEDKSNLDMHCEAAVAFKGVFHNEKLCELYPQLPNVLLDHILQNISAQKENLEENRVRLQMGAVPQIHHMGAAAWLETLVEIADRVSPEALKQYIVPVVQQQAEPAQRVQRRIIATKLLNKLADVLPPIEVRKELGPCAQILCQDSNASVRTAMAQRLPVIARALKNPSDVVSLLLPCLVQLFKDDDNTVREACMNNLTQCLSHLTNDAKRTTIFPLIRKITDQCIEKKDDNLMVVAKHLGEWAYNLQSLLDNLDQSWVLNTYLRMCSVSQGTASGPAGQAVLTMTRRMCAYNAPCIIDMFPKHFERIIPVYVEFCSDGDEEVRTTVAASFHEVLHRQPSQKLLHAFIELIRSGAPEVVAKLTKNLDRCLPILYKLASEPDETVTHVQLNRILIGCNQLLRGTGSWRAHESLLRNMTVLAESLNFNDLHDTFTPVLQKETLSARAIPCRIAAVTSLLTFMRQQPAMERRKEIVSFFQQEIAIHPCCYRRALFLDTVEIVLRVFSKRFFVENFLNDTVRMTADKISNIRLKAIHLLPKIKSFLTLPDDDATLQILEKAVKEALATEKDSATRILLQSYACDLSRTEARARGDREDQLKEEEENRLWNENRSKAEKRQKKPLGTLNARVVRKEPREKEKSASPKASGLKPPEPVRAVSPYRQQRRAVAVVRPQPVVVMRSASPSPSERPSRLPLSVVARENLKKAATESALPRPTRSSSVSSPRSVMSTSTSSLESSSSVGVANGFGLRRSATTTTGFGNFNTSSSAYALCSSRSSSHIRRPSYGLTKVSSQSTFERKPSHVSMRVRGSEI